MVTASSVGHRFARDGSTKQECWYCLNNIRAFILHWVWCSALGFYWCGFDVKVETDVKVEKNVYVKEQKPGSLVPFFITAVMVKLGEWDEFWEFQQRWVPFPLSVCIMYLPDGPSVGFYSHSRSQILLRFFDITVVPWQMCEYIWCIDWKTRILLLKFKI